MRHITNKSSIIDFTANLNFFLIQQLFLLVARRVYKMNSVPYLIGLFFKNVQYARYFCLNMPLISARI